MKTASFLKLLGEHPNTSLVFEYEEGNYIKPNYHITEVKNTTIESVDCGAKTHSWKETIIQLWENPSEKDKTTYLSAYKALSILKKVNRIKPMEPSAEVKFEYGNENFHTTQLFVNDYKTQNKNLIITLAPNKTTCKASEICGIPNDNLEEEKPCCNVASNCC